MDSLEKINTQQDWVIKEIDVNSKEWSELLLNNDHSIFQKELWATILKDGFKGDICCIIICKNSEIVGGMLGIILKILFFKLLYFNLPVGGIIGDSPEADMLSKLLNEFAIKKGVCKIRINSEPDFELKSNLACSL